MGILAVHSQNDGTCPFRSEEMLWCELLKKGSEKLHVCFAPEVNHCSMFERSYGDDAYIFKWLLAHQLGDNEVDDDESPVSPPYSQPSAPRISDPSPQQYTPASPTVANGACPGYFATYRGSSCGGGTSASSRDRVPLSSA